MKAHTLVAILTVFAGCNSNGGESPVNYCQEICTQKADCPAGAGDCLSGDCVECTQDAHCTADPKRKYCNQNLHLCVFCKAASDCDASFKGGCNATLGICRLCGSDADCTGLLKGTGKCDPNSGLCIKCTGDADCNFALSPGKYCGTFSTSLGSGSYCVKCKDNSHCTSPQICESGSCVDPSKDGCTTDADCSGLKCNTTFKMCECTDTQMCQSAFGAPAGNLKWSCSK